jgi:hypothetical protein
MGVGRERRVMSCGGGEWEGGGAAVSEPRSPAASRQRESGWESERRRGRRGTAKLREARVVGRGDVGRRRWRH